GGRRLGSAVAPADGSLHDIFGQGLQAGTERRADHARRRRAARGRTAALTRVSTSNFTTPNAHRTPNFQLPKPFALRPLESFGSWALVVDWELGVVYLGIDSEVFNIRRTRRQESN